MQKTLTFCVNVANACFCFPFYSPLFIFSHFHFVCIVYLNKSFLFACGVIKVLKIVLQIINGIDEVISTVIAGINGYFYN